MAKSDKTDFDLDTLRGMLRRIVSENARDYAGTYAFAIACLILVSLSTAYMAWILKDIVDEATSALDTESEELAAIENGIYARFLKLQALGIDGDEMLGMQLAAAKPGS